MTLRVKTLIIIGLTLVGLVLLLSFFAQAFWLRIGFLDWPTLAVFVPARDTGTRFWKTRTASVGWLAPRTKRPMFFKLRVKDLKLAPRRRPAQRANSESP